MKSIFTRTLFVLLVTVLYQTAIAQTTYSITSNVSSSYLGADGFSTCNNCIFNISPGITFTINTGGTCNGCTFNGGTVNLSNSCSVTWNNTTAFKSDTVLINTATTFNTASFTNDSLHINANLTASNSTETFSGSSVEIASGVTLSLQQTTFTNSVFAFAGSSGMSVNNSLSATGTSFYLNGTSTVSSSGTTTIQTGSNVVLDGTTNSFSANNLNTVANGNILLNSTTSSTFTAATLTMTGGSISTSNNAAVTISNGISLTGTVATFNGATLKAASITTSGGSFSASGSAITDNNALSLTNTTTSLNNTSLSASSISTTDSSFALNGTTAVTDNNAATFSGTAVSFSGSAKLSAASGSLTANGSTDSKLTMSGTASLSVTNAFNLTSSDAYLYDNSTLTANSMAIATNSYFQIGDGTLAGTAHLKITNTFSDDNTSTVAIANHNNYLYTTNNLYAINTVSCGGGGTENTCQLDYVYGCATLSSTSATGCVSLALADITLTAVPTGHEAVTLSWSDAQSTTAEHYLVQRSTDNSSWTTLATVAAGGYTAGDYQFEDPAALAGTDIYRIARVDQNGAILYSGVSAVNIAGAAGTIGIYPNPASGHTFYIRTPDTKQLTVNIYTVTGQLLSRQSLQGQLQYQLQLPSQLLPGSAVIVQAITLTGKQAFPLLLQ